MSTLLTVICSAITVAMADVLIKKAASHTTHLLELFTNPIFLAAIGLYLVQITLFAYVFMKKADLGTIGVTQTILYDIIVVGSGLLIFKENLSLSKGLGIVCAILALYLINYK